jgi:hypothetical protein
LTAEGGRGSFAKLIGGRAMVGRAASIALAFTFALALGGGASSPARAAGWLEKNFWLSGPNYSRHMPPCDYPPALGRIADRFHTKEARFWNSELRIVGIKDIRETAYLPWAAQSIPRRFCRAVAMINDGVPHALYYSIASGTGMIGASWGVEFCVVGLDRNWAYNPACRAAKP